MQKQMIEGYRLSPQQKRLWLLQKNERAVPYSVHCAVQIEGRVDRAVLKAALEATVVQHEILRTTFQYLPGLSLPLQVVNGVGVRWGEDHELGGLGAEQQQAKIEELFREKKQSQFDFERGPLLHASVITLSLSDHILLLGLPAVCADKGAITNLVRKIARSYEALRLGQELRDEPMQYADISEYQTHLLEAEDTRAGREYWRACDISKLHDLRLPFNGQPDDEAGFAPSFVALTINPELVDRIQVIAEAHGTTSAALLLACWQVLLWRVTGQRELMIGVAFQGRTFEGLEELPGLFEKYLPLHSRLEGRTKFVEHLKQVNDAALRLAEWQDYFNWDDLNSAAGGAERLNFFSACFEFEERLAGLAAGGVTFSIVKQYSCIDRFNIKLACVSTGPSLITDFHYDPFSFSAEDVECLAEQFHTLLRSAIANPETAIGRLEILSPNARRRLLVDFNNTKRDFPDNEYVHQRIEKQSAIRPNDTAVVFGDKQYSFSEINSRANQLAHYLRVLGVGPDALVGICLERSAEMVVAILGILKAGGAYVPLDPTYPKERLAFMLEDMQAPVLITQQGLIGHLAAPQSTELIILDQEQDQISRFSSENLISRVNEDNLAYVIYTSGSTGRPKGVMITHGGLMNYLDWASDAYKVAEGQGAPVHSSIGFDLTVTSLFPPLITGRRVVLVDEQETGEGLSEALRHEKDFSLVKITPAHLQILNLLLKKEETRASTRALIIGGEALYAETLSFWRTHAPETRIINEYGPTETVVGCCVYEVEPAGNLNGAVPIGRPIANTQIYILNEYLEPVPVKVAGEIFLGGQGVARGYLNRPGITAERFVPDPFGGEGGARLYRTGDLGRYNADGVIEYLGRADHQVKIKGWRIELGEIEGVLGEHPDVREAVVTVWEEAGEKQLVGYVSAKAGAKLSANQMRGYAEEKLPVYMVPQLFVILDRLPLTSNGKVDRGALPSPDVARAELEKAYVPPRTPTEKLLAELWAKALGLERVGIYHNFFELGGDSILSIQIANRANQAGIRFTPRQIFQCRTIANLASSLETSSLIQSEQGIVSGLVPLTPIQHWFFEQNIPDRHHWNQAIMFELQQPLDPAALEETLQQLVTHHDVLRLSFVEGPSGWQQSCEYPADRELLIQKKFSSAAAQEQAISAFASQLQASLRLTDGQMMKAALLDLGPTKPNRLMIVIHHLAVDIVSWGILLDHLQLTYQQLIKGEAVALRTKTTSFKSWAERLKLKAQTSEVRQELDYWLAEPRRWACKVPVDFHGGANTEVSARNVWVSLTAEQTKHLLQDVPKAYRTMINDVLLTALAQAFSMWTRSRSFLVDLENHGREDLFDDVDLSRTVGWFTCIFPLTLNLGEAAGPGEALKLIKEQIRGVPNGGIGYGLLRYLCDDAEVTEKFRALPQAEISFNYVGRSNEGFGESSMFSATRGSVGPAHSPRSPRRYLIELNGDVNQGQLRMIFTYSENLHLRSTIEEFANAFIECLKEIIDHCLSPNAGGRTPSDFLLSDMSQRELDKLIAELNEME